MKCIRLLLVAVCFFTCISSSFASSVYLLGVGRSHGLWTKTSLTNTWQAVANSGSVIDVTVLADGRLLGVGKSNTLLVRDNLGSSWKAVPNSGNVIAVDVMSNGTILGVGKSLGLWTRSSLNSPWQPVPNSSKVIDVAVMPDGRILGVGQSNGLWVRNTLYSPWQAVPNSGDVIAVTVKSNGTIIGVGRSYGLWTRTSLTSPWKSVSNSGEVIDVTDGAGLQTGGNPCPPGPKTVKWKGQVWQRCDDGIERNWWSADTYCKNLTLDGYDDWRLPKLNELKGLVVCSNGTPTPLKTWPNFPSSCGDGYYSDNYNSPTISNTFSCSDPKPWGLFYWASDFKYMSIDFVDGTAIKSLEYDASFTRCIRAGMSLPWISILLKSN